MSDDRCPGARTFLRPRKGKLKTARKGVGTAEIIVTGCSAHAGLDPAAGVNAVHELALQIARLMKMNCNHAQRESLCRPP